MIRTLRIEEAVGTALKQARPVLREAMDEKRLLLGGGTVLAARWGHRRSTDADLTYPSGALARLIRRDGDAFEKRLRREIEGVDPARTWAYNARVYLWVNETEITIVEREDEDQDASTDDRDRIEGLPYAAHSTREILQGKVLGRIFTEGALHIRDIYDLVTAYDRHDRGAWKEAFEGVSEEGLTTLAWSLQHLPPDWYRTQEKQVVGRTHEGSDEEFVARLARVVREEARKRRQAWER